MRNKHAEVSINKLARPVAMVLLLAISVLLIGACNRSGSRKVSLVSSSNAGVANAPINNGSPANSSAPFVSYADVVSRVSPAVITIHSEMRVRAAQQYPFMDDP